MSDLQVKIPVALPQYNSTPNPSRNIISVISSFVYVTPAESINVIEYSWREIIFVRSAILKTNSRKEVFEAAFSYTG